MRRQDQQRDGQLYRQIAAVAEQDSAALQDEQMRRQRNQEQQHGEQEGGDHLCTVAQMAGLLPQVFKLTRNAAAPEKPVDSAVPLALACLCSCISVPCR